MVGQLHQLNIEYDAVEDRLILRANTTDKQELRLWLTRRFTRQLWDSLMKILQQNPELQKVGNVEARKAMVAMRQDQTLAPEQFGRDYADDASGFPLGESPALLTGFSYDPGGEETSPRMAFQTVAGHEIALTANERILHSLARLLEQAVPATGWDLRFAVGYASDDAAEAPASAKVH